MSNARRFRRGPSRGVPLPNGRKHVKCYSETELTQLLVEDGVKRYFGADARDEVAYLAWFVAACQRIGKLSGQGAEAAFQKVDGEVYALCGQHLRVA